MDQSDATSGALASLLLCFPFGFIGLWMLFIVVMWIIALGGLVLWVIMLIDVVQRDDSQFPNPGGNERMVWILVVALTGWIGGLVYYFTIYRKLGKAKGTSQKK